MSLNNKISTYFFSRYQRVSISKRVIMNFSTRGQHGAGFFDSAIPAKRPKALVNHTHIYSSFLFILCQLPARVMQEPYSTLAVSCVE
jgi:hypothetical protein